MRFHKSGEFRNIPALVIGFRRPDAIAKVLRSVRANVGAKIYVFVDRPRDESDLQKSLDVVSVAKDIVPGASVFRPTAHRGCKMGVVEAISTFLDENAFGYILEDDCVPSSGFFSFVGTYLIEAPRIAAERNIMMVSGRNDCGTSPTRRPWLIGVGGTWGWGTWAEKWSAMDLAVDIPSDTEMSDLSRLISREHPKKWDETVEGVKAAQKQLLDTWDYQWALSRWQRDGLSLVPQRNLVRNIGFGLDATHTSRRLKREPRRHRRAVSRGRNLIDDSIDSAEVDLEYLRGACRPI